MYKISLDSLTFIIGIIIPMLIRIAYLTLAERKVLGAMQKRVGPNIVGFFGLLQPLSDGLKLAIKERVVTRKADKRLFLAAPILTFSLRLISWRIIPFASGVVAVDINLGILVLFAISSLGVYGIILAGWSRNSRYAFLGALRSAAQMISYEVSFGLIIMNVIIVTNRLNLREIIFFQNYIWLIVPLFPISLMFFVSALAETNRPPFDLPEAEAELVSGYNVEYSALGFAFFFLGEYANMILMSRIGSILFLGGYLSGIPFVNFESRVFLGIKTSIVLYLFIWVRAAFPRYRYDQLMDLGWKSFLPLSIAWVIFVSGILLLLNNLPS